MTKSPAFQFYPKDFLVHSKQIALSAAGAGIYIRLLCYCWLDGSLPCEMAALSKLAGVTVAELEKEWPLVQKCFIRNSLKRMVSPRLSEEKAKQANYRKLQREHGLNGAKSRWATPFLKNGVAIVSPMAKNSSSSSSSSSSPSSELKKPMQRRQARFDEGWHCQHEPRCHNPGRCYVRTDQEKRQGMKP